LSADNEHVRLIRPDSRMAEGSITAIRHLIGEIWSSRSHIRVVFAEQFRSIHYGSRLGVIWGYVLPLVPLSVYVLLAKIRVFPNFEGVNGTVFITFGVTLWFLFSGCIQTPIRIIQSRNTESMKTAFPLSAAIISGFAQLLFDTMLRVIFVIIVMIVTKSLPTLQGLLLPLVLFPAILLFLGVGLFLGILNVIYNDVSRVVTIALQYGIFISGVIFPFPQTNIVSRLNSFNPFYVFIEASRSLVAYGSIVNLESCVVIGVLAIFVFMLSCKIFFIMEYRVRGIN